jgi:hypothetical protein
LAFNLFAAAQRRGNDDRKQELILLGEPLDLVGDLFDSLGIPADLKNGSNRFELAVLNLNLPARSSRSRAAVIASLRSG